MQLIPVNLHNSTTLSCSIPLELWECMLCGHASTQVKAILVYENVHNSGHLCVDMDDGPVGIHPNACTIHNIIPHKHNKSTSVEIDFGNEIQCSFFYLLFLVSFHEGFFVIDPYSSMFVHLLLNWSFFIHPFTWSRRLSSFFLPLSILTHN